MGHRLCIVKVIERSKAGEANSAFPNDSLRQQAGLMLGGIMKTSNKLKFECNVLKIKIKNCEIEANGYCCISLQRYWKAVSERKRSWR